MKNQIDPTVLASLKKSSPEDIVNFLDKNKDIKTVNLCKLIGMQPRVIYDRRTYNKRHGENRNSVKEAVPIQHKKKHNKYSPEEKFYLVEQYNSSDDKFKVELLRKYGLYSSDIDRWKDQIKEAAILALGKRKTRSDKKSPEMVELEAVKKELKEQEKTSAKLSSLLVLQKKTFDFLKRED